MQTKYLGIALHKAERLEELINEFFDITRFNFAKASLQMQQVNLTMLLEQVIFEFQPILLEKQLTCQLHAPSQVMVHCDGNKMQRVFDNLLRNACLYSFSKECIHIEVHVNQQYVNICFMNRAQTIPQEKLAHLFEQFYRLDMARHTSGGTGLGLAIAKQIVEWHHGKIEAKSADEQIEFYVSLPLIHQ